MCICRLKLLLPAGPPQVRLTQLNSSRAAVTVLQSKQAMPGLVKGKQMVLMGRATGQQMVRTCLKGKQAVLMGKLKGSQVVMGKMISKPAQADLQDWRLHGTHGRLSRNC